MTNKVATTYLKEYQPSDYLIDTVKLTFELDEADTKVTTCLNIRRNPKMTKEGETLPPLVLAGDETLVLCQVIINDQPLSQDAYHLTPHDLTLIPTTSHFTLETMVKIKPQHNTALSGLYKSAGNFCTQCEAEGFRRITYFLDRPDVLAQYTVTIHGDKTRYPWLLSNGNLVAQGEGANNRHWVQYVDPFPKPSYLFALVAGDLEKNHDTFITCSGKSVTLQVFTEKGNKTKGRYALECLKKAMKWDEQVFGREYDLNIYNIVAVSFFNMGAMENKSLNIFNSQYILVNPETATDKDYHHVLLVVAHEYFHNWSGNRVTCRDWFQLSLKEGLTVFREQQFMESMGSPVFERIQEAKNMRLRQFVEDAGPLAHPVQPESYERIDNFYTMTIYHKGAAIITLLQTLLSRETFRQGLDHYFSTYDGQAVTIYHLLESMASVSGKDLTLFKRWYTQIGTPQLTCSGEYISEKQQFILKVEQTLAPNNQPLPMPIPLALYDQTGKEIYPETVLTLTEEKQVFVFEKITTLPIPSLFRHFAAPVKYTYPYEEQDYLTLIMHDTDGFNRWDLMQQYLTKHLLTAIAAYKSQNDYTQSKVLILNLFKNLLTTTIEDKLFFSELLTLPAESYLWDFQTITDIEATYAIRKEFAKGITQYLYEALITLYEANNEMVDYQYSIKEYGRRALKNKLLQFIMLAKNPETIALCMNQFLCSHNMTDTFAALSCLVDIECSEREECLNTFYHRWQNDPLVMDKWFAVQAGADHPGLEQINNLLAHPLFDYSNPNRVRSVLTTWVNSNPRSFHCATGVGYELLVDQIIKIDPLNPQLAARLVEPLTQWQRHETQRQLKMQAQLERLAGKSLSADLKEIVTKSL